MTRPDAIGAGATGARQQLGRLGEEIAAERLAARGWQIVARGWRTRRGEIDIIARDGEMLVFVEVRTRRAKAGGDPRMGRPEESVTAKKQLQLAHMAEEYLFAMGWDGPWRADVAAIEVDARGQVMRFAYYEDAISG
jgi:putative endonuclease